MVEPVRGCHRICMASDFFYPNVGGVENHIYELSARLVSLGHKVIVVTRSYARTHRRGGVRYLRTGVKVYYAPVPDWWRGTSIPTSICTLPLIHSILVREQIDIVHNHQAGSALGHEVSYAAQLLGIPTVYTEHSLMGFEDLSSIALNMMMEFSLCDDSRVICVSHCAKENLVLRACISPDIVYVIPNAINAEEFMPATPEEREQNRSSCSSSREEGDDEKSVVNVVLLSRLVYRKGMDLAVGAIPELCRRHKCLHFIVGGDGPMRLAMEEMREREQLQERVEMLGEVPHDRVRDVLVRGDIFLNCSLTEGFCIAIVEAAAAGLLVVTTSVGGIPEVLPQDMVLYTPASVSGVVESVSQAIPRVLARDYSEDPYRQHDRVQRMYNWTDVARRTERVYAAAISDRRSPGGILHHIKRKWQLGWVAGPFWSLVAVLEYLLLVVCALFVHPPAKIDTAREIPRSALSNLSSFLRMPSDHSQAETDEDGCSTQSKHECE